MDESYCGSSHELQDDSLTGGTHSVQQPETSKAPNHRKNLIDELTRQNEQLKAALAAKDEQLQLILKQLAHVDKLVMLGTLGASVAHELNNPLTVISAEAEEIIDAIEGGHENQKLTVVSAKHIRQCADKMRYFVDHLRQYSRKDETTPWQKVDINTTIHDALLMLKPRLREANIQVQLSLAKTLPKIWGHRIKLESVFQNLIANAIDAFTPDCKNRRRSVTISTTQETKNGVVAKIIDNGCGMSEEVRSRMFDPFFTTKESDQGTGLGLAMVNTYLQDHHAELEVESQEDKGTVMTIRFPLERRASLAGQSDSQQSRVERKNILVVDDEGIILDVLRRRLERMGFIVKIAHDGQRAIDILQSEKVDLIVCDATLPASVDSHEVLKVSRARQPHASFVAMSGHLETDEAVQRLMRSGASLFIKKPFHSLRKVTREIAGLLTSD